MVSPPLFQTQYRVDVPYRFWVHWDKDQVHSDSDKAALGAMSCFTNRLFDLLAMDYFVNIMAKEETTHKYVTFLKSVNPVILLNLVKP